MTNLFTGALRSIPIMYARWLWYRYGRWYGRRKPMSFYRWAAMEVRHEERMQENEIKKDKGRRRQR